MLKSCRPQVVGHFDLIRMFRNSHPLSPAVWQKLERNVDVIKEYGGLVEVNSRAWKKKLPDAYPQRNVLKLMLSKGVLFTLSDNSHGPADVGMHYGKLLEYVRSMEIERVHWPGGSMVVSELLKRMSLFEVTSTSTKGKGLFATKSIKAGSTILKESACIAVLDSPSLLLKCSKCFKPASQRCSKCKTIVYCGRNCQQQDWAMHRLECASITAALPNKLTTALRAVLRILILYETDQARFTAQISQLCSNGDKFTKDTLETFAQMIMLLSSLKTIKITMPATDLVALFCQFSCNSMSISDGELVNYGVGIFPTLSLTNHSCNPNCAVIFDGTEAYLRSLRDIQVGEELTQSYVDLAEPFEKRRSELQSRYFFDCSCELCTKELDEKARLSSQIYEDLKRLRDAQQTFLDQGEFAKAQSLSDKLLSIYSQVYPPGHPLTSVQAIINAKLVCLVQEQVTPAMIECMIQAVQLLTLSHGPDHELTKDAYYRLSDMKRSQIQ